MKNIDRLHQGKYNHMHQEGLPDGSVIIALVDRRIKTVYKLRIRNLNQENEEVLDYATGEPIAK